MPHHQRLQHPTTRFRMPNLALIQAMLAILILNESVQSEDFYKPIVKDIEGWQVEIDPKILAEENREVGEQTLAALANHLQRIVWILPKDRVQSLRKLPIRIDWEHDLTNMQYHPGRGWLEQQRI